MSYLGEHIGMLVDDNDLVDHLYSEWDKLDIPDLDLNELETLYGAGNQQQDSVRETLEGEPA
jgi:hypothetical protein